MIGCATVKAGQTGYGFGIGSLISIDYLNSIVLKLSQIRKPTHNLEEALEVALHREVMGVTARPLITALTGIMVPLFMVEAMAVSYLL